MAVPSGPDDDADVGQKHHRELALEELRNGAATHLAERAQGPVQVEDAGQEGLRGFQSVAGIQANGPPPPALVEKCDGTGGLLALDLEPG